MLERDVIAALYVETGGAYFGIPDVDPSLRYPVGHEEKGLDGFESRMEYMKLPPFFKRGFDLIYKSS